MTNSSWFSPMVFLIGIVSLAPVANGQDHENSNSPIQTPLIFELDIESLLSSRLGTTLVQNEFVKLGDESDWLSESFKIGNISKIAGAIHIPDSVAKLASYVDENELPHFLLRIQFAKDDVVKRILEKLTATIEPITIEEIAYFPVYSQADNKVVLKKVGDSSIEIGTKKLLMNQRKNLISQKIRQQWKQLPGCPLRIVWDIDSSRSTVDEVVHLMRPTAPKEFAELFDLVNLAKSVSICVDPANDSFVNVSIQFSQSANEQLPELKAVLDGLMFVFRAKLNGFFEKDEGDVIQFKPRDFKSQIIDNRIALVITKPKNFDNSILKIIGQVVKNSKPDLAKKE